LTVQLLKKPVFVFENTAIAKLCDLVEAQ
jgi:hypothetical protein